MSKRAEDAALKAYPMSKEYTFSQRLITNDMRDGFIQGYERAEKDLALTWIDIRNILSIAREVEDENDDCPLLKSDLCDEILKRFNEQRKK